MPIKRYVDYLRQRGELERYMRLLVDNFNPHAAEVRPLHPVSAVLFSPRAAIVVATAADSSHGCSHGRTCAPARQETAAQTWSMREGMSGRSSAVRKHKE